MTTEMTREYPTVGLRFIAREGKNILQQAYEILTLDLTKNSWEHARTEWRDIPFVTPDGNELPPLS